MKLVAALLVCLTLPIVALGATADLYTDQELAEDKPRYTERVQFLLEKGLLDFMSPRQRRQLRHVVVRHPLRGAGLLAIRSAVVEDVPMIRAPVQALKFIEDLSVAYAWRYQNRYSLEPMDEYLVMLKHRPVEQFPGGRKPAPLSALGVPPRIWERDPQVDDLSLRFRNTAWAFILAHELGHLLAGHSQTPATGSDLQLQEEQADAYAIDLLARSGTIPMGMILWFQATAGFMQNRSDFDSEAAYLEWARREASHPVNGRRMRALAEHIQRWGRSTADRNHADVLHFIALRLAAIGRTVEDPEIQQHLRRCADQRRPADLQRLDDRPCQ